MVFELASILLAVFSCSTRAFSEPECEQMDACNSDMSSMMQMGFFVPEHDHLRTEVSMPNPQGEETSGHAVIPNAMLAHRAVVAADASHFRAASPCGHQDLHSEDLEQIPPGPMRDLIPHYDSIFETGNRNCASHLWVNFILQRSHQYSDTKLEMLFTAFCGISGSLLEPGDDTRWRMTLPAIGGGSRTGFMYYCSGCRGWPCLCDAQDWLKVDTKTVILAGGEEKEYLFTVLGDPCKYPEKLTTPFEDPSYHENVTLKMAAPELACEGGHLKGAQLSDHGHPIVAMFHEDADLQAHNEHDFKEKCDERAAGGYKSGMGILFHKLGQVNPLNSKSVVTSAPQVVTAVGWVLYLISWDR